ncbi:unannotated protein [freshwater metagenome]|uniref:Unannotated protein n=1 Tax=freshwater metagenome TaxID=449393 RepID=A0A6J7KT82_9ZZZZ|nr:glucose 1-dehydrogenase [Actinomycetota bacterium]
MDRELENKVAVVTGGAGGIGREACRVLAREGASIVAVDLSDSVSETVAMVSAMGGRAKAVKADVSDPADVERYLDAAEEFGGIDLLFNNAGIFAQPHPLDADYPVDVFDQVLKVNVRGVWLGMRGAFPRMAAKGGGVVVNTSSVAGLRGYAGVGPYVTSKHAVIGLTRHAAAEGGPLGIRVVAVCPATVETTMGDEVRAMFGGDEAFAEYIQRTVPMGRLVKPHEVAEVVAFLMSDRASSITGSAIPIDGGVAATG